MYYRAMNRYNTDDCIYALATAWAKSAIAVVRISGRQCIETLSKAIGGKVDIISKPSNTAVYCKLISPKDLHVVDDVVVTVYRDGHGYTGEDAAEISCHGGLSVVQAVLSTMAELGFRQALPGEFSLRAFLHGKMDLTRAEAVNELINAQGNAGRAFALKRLNGQLYRRIERIKSTVMDIMGTVEVQLDYSDDEIGEDLTFPMENLDLAISEIATIRDSYNTGRLYSQGAKIVLAGPSNAGKSSLFNLFLKEDRSIVSPTKGTTRDYIEALCSVNGIPVKLYDTAGFRNLSESDIEEEGIRRSHNLVEGADIVIYMVDSSDIGDIDASVVSDSRCIPVLNKVDLNDISMDGFVRLSVSTGLGFQDLCDEITRKLASDIGTADESSLVIENDRQRENLSRAATSLKAAKTAVENGLPLDIVSMDIQEAIEALGELTGEVTTDDILDRIFGSFCVGK